MKLFWADLAALGITLIVGASLFLEMYYFGWAGATATTPDLLRERDIRAVRMIAEAAILTIGFGWMSYRLVRGGYHGVAKPGR